MTTRKRTDYLSLSRDLTQDSEGEESQVGYDSEEHESRGARALKRRKVSTRDENEQSYFESEGSANKADFGDGITAGKQNTSDSDIYEDAEENIQQEQTPSPPPLSSIPKSTPTNPAKPSRRKKSLKTGIIYLPRLPPFLKPTTLRTLLTPYTKHGISRLFLTPESPTARLQRLRSGGNKKHLYTDGWVEFCSKTDAKIVVDACNGRIVGGKKGGYYRDDVWSMRYLRGFKWGDLVGERRDEEAERTGRLDAERRKGKREVALFLGNVEKAKVGETRRRKEEARMVGGGDGSSKKEERVFTFRQNEGLKKTVGEGGNRKAPGEEAQRVLSKIF